MAQEITLEAIEKIVKNAVSTSETSLKNFFTQKIDEKLDGLTETMLASFDRVYNYMDTRFNIIDKTFDGIEHKLEKIEFQAPEKRIAILEDQVKLISTKLGLT